MASLKPVLNRLTLRIATGFTGNINRSVSPQMIISYYDDYRNISNNIYHIGKVVSPPNPNLRWEKTQDVKVALDFGMFNDRLTGIVEGYYRKSKDIVTGVQVLSSTGFTNRNTILPILDNKGIDATLNGTPIKNKRFQSVSFANIATTRIK